MSKLPSVHGEEVIDDCPLGNFIDVEAVPSPPPKMGHAPTAKKGRLHRLEVVSALSQPGVDKLKEFLDKWSTSPDAALANAECEVAEEAPSRRCLHRVLWWESITRRCWLCLRAIGGRSYGRMEST